MKVRNNELKLFSSDIKDWKENDEKYFNTWVADLGQCKNDPQVYMWPMNDFRYYSGFEDQKREYYGRSHQAKILP